jgi:hypothetical protein
MSFIACLTASSEVWLAFQPTPTPAGDEKPQFAIFLKLVILATEQIAF